MGCLIYFITYCLLVIYINNTELGARVDQVGVDKAKKGVGWRWLASLQSAAYKRSGNTQNLL